VIFVISYFETTSSFVPQLSKDMDKCLEAQRRASKVVRGGALDLWEETGGAELS